MNRTSFLALGFFLLVNLPVGFAAETTIGGYSPEQAMRFGEQMYRRGLLPSGEPMRAYVQGDIPVDGTMFSCESCHLRSGLGSAEGTIITLPTNGGKLFKPLHRGAEIDVKPDRSKLAAPFQSQDIRPGYTEEKLRDVIWAGVDAGGRELSETMPRFELDTDNMDIMVHYLKNLSTDYSPGVDDQTLTFATVITDDVSPADRQALLDVLQAYFKDRNSQNRHEELRSRRGPFYKQDRYTAYRKLELRVWDLSGPPESWSTQLEAYYQEKPVFALLGGISNQSWEPIHDFSERNRLPTLLPQTPFPVLNKAGWYTLYFSKGYYQEGEAAARFLHPDRNSQPPEVVQVVRAQSSSLALSQGFAETWRGIGHSTPPTVTIEKEGAVSKSDWKALADEYPGATLLLWLPSDDLLHVRQLEQEKSTTRLIFSSSLLSNSFSTIPEELRDISLITYPYRLPKDMEPRKGFVKKWLEIRKIPETNLSIQSKAFFINWMMTGVLRMMGDDFYRDYFFDVVDMMNDETYAIVNYPRLSFGPAQRYASKGCYLTMPGPGIAAELVPRSSWVIH